MNKLMLDPESLRVESFQTSRTAEPTPGIIRAHAWTNYYYDPTAAA